MPAPPAAWRTLPSGALLVDLDRVRRALGAAPPRQLIAWGGATAVDEAGVLVPLFEEDGEAWLILTRRAAHLRRNGGDVAFPGGRTEPGESVVEAALREASEEIGLDPASVTVLGELDHFVTVTGATEMVPIVGALPGRPTDLEPNPGEVDAILTLPVAELLAEEVHRPELWGDGRLMHQFDLVGDTVWGATARVLHRFLELVIAVPPTAPGTVPQSRRPSRRP